MEEKENINLEKEEYKKEYNEKSFFDKLKKVLKVVGVKGVYMLLLLYNTLQRKDIPPKEKSIIIGALGYFILPLDALPDITPIVGYSDDIFALGMAILKVMPYIDDEMKEKSKEQIKKWFKIPESELNLLID
ncbi:YkvA family protein [uncultured Fusobacterium sp.]|uniref:YkvA family protein n=1 Tax=uncultured Fusobacterium sp. TaxID=159267 RepID=UPI0025D80A2A|nr:YkvA family protein [uncultured Fusobacterium sp.]